MGSSPHCASSIGVALYQRRGHEQDRQSGVDGVDGVENASKRSEARA